MHLALLDRATGTSYDVWKKEGIIGRDGSCAVALTGDAAKLVSSRHARVFVADGKWWIEDSGSRNGTFVHGSKIEVGVRHALHKGVVIGLGATGTRLEVIGAEVMADAAKTMLEGFTAPEPAARPAAPSPAPRPAMNAGATMLDPGAAWEPAPKRSASDGHQVHVVLRGAAGDMHTIDAAIARLGRSLDCDVHVDGDKAGSVSRVHTEILIVGGRVVVRDGGSRHGTLLNGKRGSTPAPLARGDTIALGPAGPSFSVVELSGGSEPAVEHEPPAHAAPASHHDAPPARAHDEKGSMRAMMMRPVLGHRSHKHAKLIRGIAYGMLVLGVGGFSLLVMANLRAERAAAEAAASQGPNWPLVARANQASVGVVSLYIGRGTRAGTGFVISPSGYFVTTRQIVRGDSGTLADSAFVTMADGATKLRADVVVVGDTAADVAILKIRDYHGPVIATIDWTGTDALQGEPAAVIGFPHGMTDAAGVARTSITTGAFSQTLPTSIQVAGFSGAASPGSPVLNRTGETVGVYRAGFSDGSGLGIAVPMARVSTLLPPPARAELKMP